jgi:hypothetical protein
MHAMTSSGKSGQRHRPEAMDKSTVEAICSESLIRMGCFHRVYGASLGRGCEQVIDRLPSISVPPW